MAKKLEHEREPSLELECYAHTIRADGKLYIDTRSGHYIEIKFPTSSDAWKWYCKRLKVTITVQEDTDKEKPAVP